MSLAPSSPVFVLGVAHSGTTILYRMLAYHPELTWFSQFSLRDGQVPRRRRLPLADRADVGLRFLRHRWQKGDSRLDRYVLPTPGEEGSIWDFLLEDDAANTQRLRTYVADFTRRHGGRRLAAKHTGFDRFLDGLRTAFPDASFVHVIRDGRPVAESLRSKLLRQAVADLQPPDSQELDAETLLGWTVERWGWAPSSPSTQDLSESALQAAAEHWTGALRRVAEDPEISPLELRYEDLCGDVHGSLRKILDHCGLDSASFPFDRCPRTLTNRNSHWIEPADGGELEAVTAIERDLLVEHGYPLRLQSTA